MSPSVESSLFFKTWIPDGVAEGIHIQDRCKDIEIRRNGEEGLWCRFFRDGVEVRMKADQVYLADSLSPDVEFLQRLGLETGAQGVKTDRRNLATNLEGVFAAGNIAQAGRYAIQGSAAGMGAARSIHRFLTGVETEPEKVDVRLPTLSLEEKAILLGDAAAVSSGGEPLAAPTPNPRDFCEVLPGFDDERAIEEAGSCLQCDCVAKKDCLLRERGTEFGANPKAFGGARPRLERDRSHPEVVHEPGKCIKCGRCVAAAKDHQEELGLTYIGRGFSVRIGVPLDHDIREGLNVAARECVAVCPTGALSFKR